MCLFVCLLLSSLSFRAAVTQVSQARPSCEGIKGANVYVCGLPKTFTQLDLESVFGQYGTVISSRILYDQITGLSKGVGFIRFDMRCEAEKAIDQLNGVIPKNATEKITVKFANNPSSKNPTLPLTIPGIPATPYMSPMKKIVGPIHAPGRCFSYSPRFSPFEGAILTNPLLAQTTAAAAAASTSSLLSGANSGWCLFVYNLPPETEDNVLWQLFGPIGAVQSVKVIRDLATQKCKGFGFVTMANYEDAYQAITTLNGYQLGERQLQVSFKSQTRKA